MASQLVGHAAHHFSAEHLAALFQSGQVVQGELLDARAIVDEVERREACQARIGVGEHCVRRGEATSLFRGAASASVRDVPRRTGVGA